MITVGIDIRGRQHAVARCRSGQDQADREVLRVSQDRAGFGPEDGVVSGGTESPGEGIPRGEGGSGGRIRTYDQSVNSRPLYH